MSDRRLPVVPNLDQLKHQAKDLLRGLRRGDANARAELQEHHPQPPEAEHAKLADAQLALARSYGASSWARLVQSCDLIDAIWKDDLAAVRALVLAHPNLLHEDAGIRNKNWGAPLSYAANVGRDRVITELRALGATDLEHAMDRAVLQGRIDTARLVHRMMGAPKPPGDSLGGPAYTMSVAGTAFLFEIGAEMTDAELRRGGAVEVLLCTDSRSPERKRKIFEMYSEHGLVLPDTPMMALHRGRIDLLEAHLRRDPSLVRRTFSYDEILPSDVGCEQPKPGTYDEGLPRTPLAGATLLHVCVEFEELEIARWLLDHGMDVDVPAAVDADGFGGHTALFSTVVSYPNFWMNFTGGWAGTQKPRDAAFARLLLDRGANPTARASMRDVISKAHGREVVREHRDITPITWGKVFHDKMVVSEPAMELIAERGGNARESS